MYSIGRVLYAIDFVFCGDYVLYFTKEPEVISVEERRKLDIAEVRRNGMLLHG